METHDKKWVLKQLAEGNKVGYVDWVSIFTLKKQPNYLWVNEIGNIVNKEGVLINLNEEKNKGWFLYKEPEKVELPEIIENINDYSRSNKSLHHCSLESIGKLSAQIKQIIKYLKAKEND